MPKKSWRFYLIYCFIIITFLLLAQELQTYCQMYFKENFGPDILCLLIFFFLPFIVNLMLGFLIGFEHLWHEMKKKRMLAYQL